MRALRAVPDCSATLMLIPIFLPSSLTIFWIPAASPPPTLEGKNPTTLFWGRYQASFDISLDLRRVSLSYERARNKGFPPTVLETLTCFLKPLSPASIISVLKLLSYPESRSSLLYSDRIVVTSGQGRDGCVCRSRLITPSVRDARLTFFGRAELERITFLLAMGFL